MGSRAKVAGLLLAFSSVAMAAGFEYTAYKGKHPLADTALLAAVDDRSTACQESNITRVDGKFTGILGPARFSARVLPGTHTFQIRVLCRAQDPRMTGYLSVEEIDVEVKDMLPLHVYVARYHGEGDRHTVTVEDLGERVEYRAGVLMKTTAF